MSRNYKIAAIAVILVGLAFFLAWSNKLASLYLAGQQDALREQWIASSAEIGTKYAYLTFDDGPSDNTDQILDVLKDKKVKASFFVVAKEGEQAEKRYQRIVKEGHSLGLHSYTHDYKKIYRSVEDFSSDIRKLDHFLYKRTKVHAKIMRFPGGSSNSIVNDITPYIYWVHEQGYEYYDWNAVSGDAISLHVSAQTLNQNILKDVHGQRTLIILMHDLSEQVHTVEALPDLIDQLRARGYRFAGIHEGTERIWHKKASE